MDSSYPFEQFDHRGFQQFASALLAAVFGPVLQPMGPGKDGGRDLYTRDRLSWQGGQDNASFSWTGYSVVQVKQKERLERPHQDAAWLNGEIRAELDAWNDDTSRGAVPDHLLFFTNVPLSAAPGAGGRDKVEAEIAHYLEVKRESKSRVGGIAEVRVWDRYMLEALVAVHDSVRHAFVGFLTVGDVLASLAAISRELTPDEVEPALRAQSRRALLDEQWVYFREAGAQGSDRTTVADVVVDLPVVEDRNGDRSTILRAVLDRAALSLRANSPYLEGARHLVIAGAPGNGKTTISQFLSQAFRASFVAGDTLIPQYRSVVDDTNAALARLKRRRPGNRRWPIRIDLAAYVQDQRHRVRFLRSLAEIVSAQSDAGNISATNAYRWLRSWPWLVIFDGLDEVADAATRSTLIETIEQFAAMVDEQNADVLIVVTTRPSGYDDELDPAHFERLDLDYLDLDEALRYGELVTKTRLQADPGRAERVVRDLHTASRDQNLRLLMRTPLQVTILSILVEGGQPPADRYGLFWEYYETVFKRERAKQTEFAEILKRHANIVTRLHERIGFLLQAASEVAGGSAATITHARLMRVLKDDLSGRGFDLQGNDIDLTEKISSAGADRLLLLGTQPDGNLGFDVRSIQELMAARYLTSGDDGAVSLVLRAAAPSPHWRNTWLFAAGRIFSEDVVHRQEQLLSLVRDLDSSAHSRLGLVSPVGPYLALEIVGEGIAEGVPRTHTALLEESFKILDYPYFSETRLAAAVWVNEARTGKDRLDVVKSAIEQRAGGPEIEARTAHAVIRDIASHVKDTNYLPRVKDLGSIRGQVRDVASPERAAPSLSDAATLAMEISPNEDVALLVWAALEELTAAAETEEATLPALAAALADAQAAAAIDEVLASLSADSREIVARALRHVRAARQRAPVGASLDSDNLLRFIDD